MSDMYVELCSIIPVMAQRQWTEFGPYRLQQAQQEAQLSNEAIARLVHVSEKTWRRWKEDGRVPTPSVAAVARALRLELRELAPQVALQNGTGADGDRLDDLVGLLQALSTGLASLQHGQSVQIDILKSLLQEQQSMRQDAQSSR